MKEKLLILDDEELILTSLEHLFEDDYAVFTARDAETALGIVLVHDLAVILCDERMPGPSGHEFLRRVKEISKASQILMSGCADIIALADALNSGQIFAYISKPWEPLKLRTMIASAVSHFKLIQAVEQERRLLRALMESIPDPIYFKDCESRFIRVNQAHARVLGALDPSECIGKSDSDYFKPEDALPWRKIEEEIIRSCRPQVDRIEPFKDYQGNSIWVSTTKVPMFDWSGQVSGIAAISRDISELKRSEEMLREQNERHRMMIETANDAFIGMDLQGSITDWNPRAEIAFGFAAAEVLGRRLYDVVVPPASRNDLAELIECFLTKQGNRVTELTGVHRDGHEFPIEATIWPVRVGNECSLNAFIRDITERRRAEEARMRETALVQLLQSVTTAANRSSNIEHTAQTCLRQICSYTGWPVGHVYLRSKNTSEELVSTGFWHAVEDSRFEAFHRASVAFHPAPGTDLPGSVLASRKPEWIVNLADEQPLSERTRATEQAGLRSGFAFPVLVEDKIIGVLEFFSSQILPPDEQLLAVMGHIGSQLGQVIIRQRAEEDLKRAKASAESANRAKSEFLTTMSHEMRTPMNAILGMADLLAESPLQDAQRDYVRIFQVAGENLLHLINDILDISKVESGHLELESVSMSLKPFLEKIILMMGPRTHGLTLSLDILPGVPEGLTGDPNRLRQILVNLLGNALKFTEQGSVILRVEPDPDGSPGWLRFSVVDTGIGIDANKIEMIFDRFTQADSSTTRKYGGTGLGLAISKGLADLMGGRIGCSSQLGKGSTFFLAAPFANQTESQLSEIAVPAQPSPPPAGPAGQVTRILIAEDSEYNLVLMQAYLKDCGFELDFAENGRIAVEKFKSGHPHLVFMDLQMPVMDGLDATRAIRQWEAETHLRPIPILALTAHAMGDGIESSLEAGCTEHLTKPIKKSTLFEAIARHIGGKIPITPPEGIEQLVPGYLANVRRDLGTILAGVDAKDCQIAGRLGHQFKGSGESYGFPEISRTGAAVELAAKSADADEIRSQILALADYLDRVEIVTADS